MKLPNTLLRTFEKEDHAWSFIKGKIRFGLLDSYRKREDSRSDKTEGRVSLTWKLANPVYCDRSSMNPYYILCTSDPEADREFLRKQFGPCIVRITDPKALLERIETVWRWHALASGRSTIERVVYNKGASLEPTPGLLPPPAYSYSQKPDSFQREMELRYVLTCTADFVKLRTLAKAEDGQPGVLDDHLTLPLPDCSDICSLT